MTNTFLPPWIRTWYLINLFILIPDWAFIMLRPRSLEGGDLAWMFPLFHIYARVDALFVLYELKIVKYIYSLGGFDILLCMYLYAMFRANASKPSFAIVAICRAVFTTTKTLLYLMYSFDYIVPAWRIPVYLMNGQWLIVPLCVLWQVSDRLIAALKDPTSKES